MKDIEVFIEGQEDQPVMIIGDFNGHVRSLGDQKVDGGGKIILEWMESTI